MSDAFDSVRTDLMGIGLVHNWLLRSWLWAIDSVECSRANVHSEQMIGVSGEPMYRVRPQIRVAGTVSEIDGHAYRGQLSYGVVVVNTGGHGSDGGPSS